jgi:hypothetical protein
MGTVRRFLDSLFGRKPAGRPGGEPERRTGGDRRSGQDRREHLGVPPVGDERRSGQERRAGGDRRGT